MSNPTEKTDETGRREGAHKRYVVGFMLNSDRSDVVLIRKNRPAWQEGCLNGVGGKVEPGESAVEAMVREFKEETGLSTAAGKWRLLCTIEWPDDLVRVGDAITATLDFYVLIAPTVHLGPLVTSRTDERVEVWNVDLAINCGHVIPNLSWLLPLARYTADVYEPFHVNATVAEVIEGQHYDGSTGEELPQT